MKTTLSVVLGFILGVLAVIGTEYALNRSVLPTGPVDTRSAKQKEINEYELEMRHKLMLVNKAIMTGK